MERASLLGKGQKLILHLPKSTQSLFAQLTNIVAKPYQKVSYLILSILHINITLFRQCFDVLGFTGTNIYFGCDRKVVAKRNLMTL